MTIQTPTLLITRNPQQGFTLIEAMIVTAIVSILAAIAIPSYQDYMRRGQLQEGFALMSGFQLRIEQSYQDNRHYGNGAADSSNCAIATPTSSRFEFSCATSDERQAYTLIGTGNSGAVRGYKYSINQNGQRRTLLFKSNEVEANCWLDRSLNC